MNSEKKKKVDFSIKESKKRKIENAIDEILDFYLPKLAKTEHLPPEKKRMIVELNPRLRRLLDPFLRYLGA